MATVQPLFDFSFFKIIYSKHTCSIFQDLSSPVTTSPWDWPTTGQEVQLRQTASDLNANQILPLLNLIFCSLSDTFAYFLNISQNSQGIFTFFGKESGKE